MKYDVIVIGSGPGGYISAVRASQLGLKAAIIEKYATMGGTCLNVGCIPSKALLDSSHHYYDAVKHFEEHGILIDPPKIDFTKMIDRKATVVEQTTGGIKYLMDKNNVDVFEGMGSFVDATHVKITKNDGSDETIEGTNIIIATGSKPASLPFIELDKERIITSAPKRLYTDPNSRPITPPPITTKCFGISGSFKASVEVIIRFLSISTPGNLLGLLPVAITIFLADNLSLFFPSICKVFASMKEPKPV